MTDTFACITIGLSGGCELLFNHQHEIKIENAVPKNSTLQDLVSFLDENHYIKERKELFLDAAGAYVRPGVLVLINNCDSEVYGGASYGLQEGDEIEFISTLHGG
ncbi:hypothetical protein AGDE_04854 [Angomonas deanei]|uniref:Ubiquitin-related modifier 1 homolog n=1 Tax=Angomonas deanei TaxID=59799 RepID=S9WSX1_9TRYP|nr:hypothetical protein AGDE_11463 [Angomonas deanei]EPY39075.1 hypothetical protein AGDE_04854 [Angomonas deanei]CAD2213716.1 Urm1 (Ubiquitin related modifier)/ThiS family, putative [Angomonas deanei]|eukprot:EPY26254.1 hypothetical protein AGDE_11463 [Angomonas deanei]